MFVLIALEAVKQDYKSIYYVSEVLKSDREFVVEAAQIDEAVLSWADASLSKDVDTVLAIVRKNWRAAEKCTHVRDDPRVVNAALACNPKRHWKPSWISKRIFIMHYARR